MIISVNPCSLRHSISLSRTGIPSTFIIGLGISLATEEMRVPFPPAIITTFIHLILWYIVFRGVMDYPCAAILKLKWNIQEITHCPANSILTFRLHIKHKETTTTCAEQFFRPMRLQQFLLHRVHQCYS